MGPAYEHFKFKIGELVSLKQESGTSVCLPMMIVERLLQECPGGIQLHYRCRHRHFSTPVDYLEIELESFDKAEQAAWGASMDALQRAKAEMRNEFGSKAGDQSNTNE